MRTIAMRFTLPLYLRLLTSGFAAEYKDASSRSTYEYCFFASQD